MRIFLSGATGVLGRRLLPQLVTAGYAVIGTTRSSTRIAEIEAEGARAVVCDALDPAAVKAAIASARPDVVIHQLTALSNVRNFKNFDQEFAQTNRLRTEGLDNLIAAARACGASRFIAQSYAGWPTTRTGGLVKVEADPLDPSPPCSMVQSLAAIRYIETTVPALTDMTGIVLRYGSFYGPGTAISSRGDMVEMVRKRRFPLIGSGAGVWSFIHVDDAASATQAAIERGAAGIYNIVDDDPAEVSRWLPALATAIGAKPPLAIPVWLGRLLAGESVLSMMTQIRGSSNAKAKRLLGWTPKHKSWSDNFTAEVVASG